MPWPNECDGFLVLKSDDFESSCVNLGDEELELLERKLEYLKDNPRHPSLNTKQLHPGKKTLKRLSGQGVDRVYEFYINKKQWRCIVYIFEEKKIVWVVGIMNHEEVRKHLKK